MYKFIRIIAIIGLSIVSTTLSAQAAEQQQEELPVFSVILAFLTIMLLVLGIFVQKRWKD
jgi:predicted transporter